MLGHFASSLQLDAAPSWGARAWGVIFAYVRRAVRSVEAEGMRVTDGRTAAMARRQRRGREDGRQFGTDARTKCPYKPCAGGRAGKGEASERGKRENP